MPTTLHGARIALRPWTDADLTPFAALGSGERAKRKFRPFP